MKLAQSLALATCLALATLTPERHAHAEEGRFDAQVFRPSAAPRDLVVVEKSEIIGHLTPTVGMYADFGLDPLAFVNGDTGQRVEAVGARLQLTLLAGIGVLDGLLDLRLAQPIIAWQTSDNLRSLGTEGRVQSQAFGDTRLTARVALPWLSRGADAIKGVGVAVSGSLSLPTGSVKAFSGDGVLTGGLTLITDYRFAQGALITANAGIWLRPDRQFAGTAVGDMAHFGVAGEAYLVQRWGLSLVGGVYGYPSLDKLPDSSRQIPAEVLMGLRWQNKHGITWTVGGSFGAACGFGAPALRFFSGITLHLPGSSEQRQIERILRPQTPDSDGDGLTDLDRCPDEPGLPEHFGCPERDSDGDGITDRRDECPALPGLPNKDGCPVAFIQGDQIVILDQVHFATNKDTIREESKPVLEAVAQVLLNHPELLEVHIEGHTDVRASNAYNINLSQRRVNSVMSYLIARGIAPERVEAKGYGHLRPLVDDSECNLPDEQLGPDCLQRTSKNRRVEFHIVRWGYDDPAASPDDASKSGTSPPAKQPQQQPSAPNTPTQQKQPAPLPQQKTRKTSMPRQQPAQSQTR